MKLHTHKWGLDRVGKELEILLINSPALHGQFYALWLSLSAEDKQRFLQQAKRVVRKHMLGNAFCLALSKDIIRKEPDRNFTYIETHSSVFEYLKTTVYRGDLRLMLTEMQSVIEEVADV